MDLGLMYKALEQGQVTMIAANATDGPLAAHDWTVLEGRPESVRILSGLHPGSAGRARR